MLLLCKTFCNRILPKHLSPSLTFSGYMLLNFFKFFFLFFLFCDFDLDFFFFCPLHSIDVFNGIIIIHLLVYQYYGIVTLNGSLRIIMRMLLRKTKQYSAAREGIRLDNKETNESRITVKSRTSEIWINSTTLVNISLNIPLSTNEVVLIFY